MIAGRGIDQTTDGKNSCYSTPSTASLRLVARSYREDVSTVSPIGIDLAAALADLID